MTSDDLTFGVDIGGTKVLGVALRGARDLVAEARVPTPRSAAELTADGAATGTRSGDDGPPGGVDVADAVASVVAELAAATAIGPEPADGGLAPGSPPPVGVGVPGMLDRRGFLVFSPNLQGAAGSDFPKLMAARLPGVPVVIENDANCAALAERALGSARAARYVLLVTLGTGIGGALIGDGTPFLGARGFAGEIGHVVVDPSGPLCPCGRRGCWERYASGAGLARLAREAAYAGRLHHVVALAGGDPELVRGEHVTRAALDGEPGALGVMEDLGWWVAMGLANLSAVLDPECIVLGGGLVEAGETLLAPTRRAFGELVEGGPARPAIEIVPAVLGERAGAAGAALAARAGGLW